jgi:hypothetical protein
VKVILALCAAALVAGAALLYRATRPQLLYGTFVGAPEASVAELAARPKAHLGKTYALDGVITKQCTTMGCFFFFVEGERELRVDLAEIAMHAPKHRNGRRARVEGQIVPYGDGHQFWASAVEFR